MSETGRCYEYFENARRQAISLSVGFGCPGSDRLRHRPIQQSANGDDLADEYHLLLQQHRAVHRVVGELQIDRRREMHMFWKFLGLAILGLFFIKFGMMVAVVPLLSIGLQGALTIIACMVLVLVYRKVRKRS